MLSAITTLNGRSNSRVIFNVERELTGLFLLNKSISGSVLAKLSVRLNGKGDRLLSDFLTD